MQLYYFTNSVPVTIERVRFLKAIYIFCYLQSS